MRQPIARWNPARSAWETGEESLCGHSDVYSETWPSSGMTLRGVAYELPTWAPPHGRYRVFVLAWPAADAEGDGRHEGWAESARLVRRPDASQRRSSPVWGSREWRDLTLMPTPTVSDTNRAGAHGDGGLDLRTAISLLPTPVVNDMGKAYTPETWDAWTARLKASHGNGNGHGDSLSIEALRMLPTPTSMDYKASGSAAYASTATHQQGTTLTDATVRQAADFGQYAPAIERWANVLRPAPAPTEATGKGGAHRLSPRFVEWMQGLPDGWLTDPAVGLTRNEQLKALGNGVVPQQCAAAVRHLLNVRDQYATINQGA